MTGQQKVLLTTNSEQPGSDWPYGFKAPYIGNDPRFLAGNLLDMETINHNRVVKVVLHFDNKTTTTVRFQEENTCVHPYASVSSTGLCSVCKDYVN